MEKRGEETSELGRMIIIVLVVVVCLAGAGWLIFKGGNAINFVKGIFGGA